MASGKFGVAPDDVVPLVEHIRTQCPHLVFRGLMTIGDLGASMASATDTSATNPDFAVRSGARAGAYIHVQPLNPRCGCREVEAAQTLVACRSKVAQAIGVDPATLALSMGMSHDFVAAVRHPAPQVDVGGARCRP